MNREIADAARLLAKAVERARPCMSGREDYCPVVDLKTSALELLDELRRAGLIPKAL